MRRVLRRDATLLLFATTMAFAGSAAPVGAEQVSSVLGIPCTTQSNGVQACIGDTAHRVHSSLWPLGRNGFPAFRFQLARR